MKILLGDVKDGWVNYGISSDESLELVWFFGLRYKAIVANHGDVKKENYDKTTYGNKIPSFA